MAISQSDLFGQLLPLPGNEPAYLGLARGLRGLTMDGRLAVATRLPSERVLAEHLGVSRTTVTRAYAELVDAGWALARQGSGTYVRLPAGERTPSLPLVPGLHADAIDLSAAAGLAPSGTAELIGRALEWLPTTLASAGYEPFGAPHLSGQIARWYSDRGLPTYPEQIVVTPGALAALGVALAATVKPGERVLVDSPTYPGALGAVRGARARPVSVALDGAWNVDAWTVALRRSGARAAYLIPDFHNPTGLLMPTRLRGRLASLLRERGCTAIIDETLVELGFGGDPRPEPWAVQDPGAITIGSLSKLLWGGVRIGWLRLPAELVDLGRATAVQRSLGASALDQLVATTFLEDPGPIISEVTARMRRARDLWLGLLVDQLPQWRADPPEGGLALWVELPRRVATRFALAASGQRLVVAPGPTFSADHTHANRLRLPLTLPPEVIPEATTRLVAAWEGLGTQDAPEGFDTLTL